MAVLKHKSKQSFVAVPHTVLYSELTPEEVGVWAFLQDQREDMFITVRFLADKLGISKSKAGRLLNELGTKGFIVRRQEKVGDPNIIEVYDTPQKGGSPKTSRPQKQDTSQNSVTEKRVTNQDIYNQDKKDSLRSSKKETPVFDWHDCESILDRYNELAPALSRAIGLTVARFHAIQRVYNQLGEEKLLEGFKIANESDLINGSVPFQDGRVFIAGIDWLMEGDKFIKVLEGQYISKRLVKSPDISKGSLSEIKSRVQDVVVKAQLSFGNDAKVSENQIDKWAVELANTGGTSPGFDTYLKRFAV